MSTPTVPIPARYQGQLLGSVSQVSHAFWDGGGTDLYLSKCPTHII